MQAFHLSQPTSLDAALAAAHAPRCEVHRRRHRPDAVAEGQCRGADAARRSGARRPVAASRSTASGLRLGRAGAHERRRRASGGACAGWPVIAQALLASASPQVRNMGTIGGNLLQRTRCGYFRDTGFACNKREPGSGCPAIAGENRMLAILGGSDHCIATHPSDLAVALTALDAVAGTARRRRRAAAVPIADFYRLPGDTPHIETVLRARRADHRRRGSRQRGGAQLALPEAARPRELRVRAGVRRGGAGDARRHRAATSRRGRRRRHPAVAAAGGGGRAARQAAGRCRAARRVGRAAGDGARPARQNAFKQILLRRAVLRALQTASA